MTFERNYLGRLVPKLPKEVTLFSDFIELIATSKEVDEYIEIIDKVLDGTYEDYEITLDAPSVFIQTNVTTASNEFLNEPPFEQTIETEEFKKLILIWKNKLPERFLDRE